MINAKFNNEVVTESKFKALIKKHLEYSDYKRLMARCYYECDSKDDGSKVSFSIPHPNGLYPYKICRDFYDEIEPVINEVIYAVDRKHAMALFLLKFGDDSGTYFGTDVFAVDCFHIDECEFHGYANDEDMYNDMYPSRPIEL